MSLNLGNRFMVATQLSHGIAVTNGILPHGDVVK